MRSFLYTFGGVSDHFIFSQEEAQDVEFVRNSISFQTDKIENPDSFLVFKPRPSNIPTSPRKDEDVSMNVGGKLILADSEKILRFY